ncbi:MAG: MATE family efflux transporter [Ardenticatenales bacterium]|nr:MATE family efflux transporter [Ardenticatenales bacterium]
MTQSRQAAEQAFKTRPHHTLFTLSIPVLFSLIAEPITGLVDTAFVARQGNIAGAALGAGTVALSSVFWIFNFLGVGTQTEVAQALGRGQHSRAKEASSLALGLAALIGCLLLLVWPLADDLANLLGASGAIEEAAATYIRYRLLGAPAVLGMLVVFGALRGLQDMRTPLWIAITINAINILLDMLLISGFGPVPALGVGGAALASTISQWVGIGWGLLALRRQLGLTRHIQLGNAANLLRVGRDLFIRTGTLTIYLSIATRVATRIGADAGAAHQAIRQIWVFSALVMEAFSVTAQSLVGYFMGSGERALAKQVAAYCLGWSVVAGFGMSGLLLLGEGWLATLLVPDSAQLIFASAWLIASISQPFNAVAFITDGIHWGTGDYRYLRNGMILATLIGGGALLLIDTEQPAAFRLVWAATTLWIIVRAVVGLVRVWPGLGQSPFKSATVDADA